MHDETHWPDVTTKTQDSAIDELIGKVDDRIFHLFPPGTPEGTPKFAFCGVIATPIGIFYEQAGDRPMCPECVNILKRRREAVRGGKP